MSYEDRYDAMPDYNSQLQSEGYAEAIALAVDKLRAILVNKPYSNFKAEVMSVIEELEGE